MFTCQALSRLAALMQMNLQVLGNPDKCDLVWDQILNVRMQLNETKIQKQASRQVFISLVSFHFAYPLWQ